MKELPFVGRENELAELMRYLERMLAGNGQVCFVTGQAGSGKSALVRHFLQRVAANHPSVVAAVGSCNSQTGIGDPYLPFREALAMLTGDPSAGQAAIESTPEMAGRLEKSRVLLLGAYRPNDIVLGRETHLENTRSWTHHLLEPTVLELTRCFGDITIDLDEIPADDSRRFVDALLDVEPNQLHPLFRDALFRQTGGHALFTVELVRSMQEGGRLARNAVGRWVESPTLDWSKLPARVEGV